MSKPEQEQLPGFPEAMAKAEQSNIDEYTRQMHLAREFIRWGKYAKFSKDPKFRERCEFRRRLLTEMMGRAGR